MSTPLVTKVPRTRPAKVRGWAYKSNVAREFDNRTPAIHHDFVRSAARLTVLLAAAMLLAWHGLLLATPHTHADHAVPQEEIACSASRPSSQNNHLHGSGRLLASHPCLACLAGSTVADAPGSGEVETAPVGDSPVAATPSDLRSRLHAHLPLLRGPPVTT